MKGVGEVGEVGDERAPPTVSASCWGRWWWRRRVDRGDASASTSKRDLKMKGEVAAGDLYYILSRETFCSHSAYLGGEEFSVLNK